MPETVLEVEDLRVHLTGRDGYPVEILQGVSFNLKRGEILGVVGESGSGKSMSALSTLRLIPDGLSQSGAIKVSGQDIMAFTEPQMQQIRGNKISVIFQDPMTGLNPVRTVGSLLGEVVRRHQKVSKSDARRQVVDALRSVGIPSPEVRVGVYPHQLSGGLRQRVMIAMALLHQPDVIIADEPTTALDATIQAQILDLMRSRASDAGLILITHDLGVAGQVCDRLIVMYAGLIVEEGSARVLLSKPRHPYTAGLLAASPRFDRRREPLVSIPGTPPTLMGRPSGCPFAPRCERATTECFENRPTLVRQGANAVACWHPIES